MKKACISMRFGRENSAADIDSDHSSYGIWIPLFMTQAAAAQAVAGALPHW